MLDFFGGFLKKITNEELRNDLKRVGNLLGKSPTGTEYEKYGKYSLFPYKSKKRWIEWCAECFKNTDVSLKQTLINNDIKELEEDLLNVYNCLKRVPSKRDYIKYGQHSVQSYIKIQSWSNWCKKVFPDFRKSNSMKISEEKLINDLKRVGEEIGHAPSVNDYKKYGKYSMSVFNRKTNWENWIKDVFNVNGGRPPDKISDQDLINNLKEVAARLGAVPKKKPSKTRQRQRHSAWRNGQAQQAFTDLVLCKQCGVEKFSHRTCEECGYYNGIKVIEPKTKVRRVQT